MGCIEGAQGGTEATAEKGRQEATIIHNYEIFTLYRIYFNYIITLIERVLEELIFTYYKMLPSDVSSVF
jgi:hypothetical protein